MYSDVKVIFYHDSDVWDDFDEDKLAPENIERNVHRILTHGGAHHRRLVRLGIPLQKEIDTS
jgi:hypothetical protein